MAPALAEIPTWSVLLLIAALLLVLVAVERCCRALANWLERRNRMCLLAGLRQTKLELMLVGLMSLFLMKISELVSNICISPRLYNNRYYPCVRSESLNVDKTPAPEPSNTCAKEDYKPFATYESLEELHRFVYFFALVHVCYTCCTLLLMNLKLRLWRLHEAELDNNIVAERRTIQIQSPLSQMSTARVLKTCFLRQLGRSVVREDYLALRQQYITRNNLPPTFEFTTEVTRGLGDQFPHLLEISIPLRFVFVFLLLLSITAHDPIFFSSFLPIGILFLAVGPLLHYLLLSLTPTARPRPLLLKSILFFIHFFQFQNSFQLASFIWYSWQFGYNSCVIRRHERVFLRLALGFVSQCFCSYSTFPVYVLVAQMTTVNHKGAAEVAELQQTVPLLASATLDLDLEAATDTATTIEELQIEENIAVLPLQADGDVQTHAGTGMAIEPESSGDDHAVAIEVEAAREAIELVELQPTEQNIALQVEQPIDVDGGDVGVTEVLSIIDNEQDIQVPSPHQDQDQDQEQEEAKQ